MEKYENLEGRFIELVKEYEHKFGNEKPELPYIDNISRKPDYKHWIHVKFNSEIVYDQGRNRLVEIVNDTFENREHSNKISGLVKVNGIIMLDERNLPIKDKFYEQYARINEDTKGNTISFNLYNGLNEKTLKILADAYASLVYEREMEKIDADKIHNDFIKKNSRYIS